MRSDARKRLEESQSEETCESCGKPLDSFACRIRHQYLDLSWTKGDH